MRRLTTALSSVFLAAIVTTSAAAAQMPGDLDETFGTGGKVVGSQTPTSITGLALSPDGKIVAAGVTSDGTDPNDFAVARFHVDGTPDLTFGNQGSVTTPISSGQDVAFAVATQPDGKSIVVGRAQGGSGAFEADMALVRYLPDGRLDEDFGAGGRVVIPDAASSGLVDVVVLPDGRIVAGGFVGGDFAVVRLMPDGARDGTFGTGGVVVTEITGFALGANLLVQPDGKYVLHGGTTDGGALARYDGDGTLDESFGEAGIVALPGSYVPPIASKRGGVALQAGGQLIVAASTSDSANSSIVLHRTLPDGSIDEAFGERGSVVTAIGGSEDNPSAVEVLADDRIVVSATTQASSDQDVAALRYEPDGALDPTFGSSGIVTTDLGGAFDIAHALVVQSDGKVLVGGFASTGYGMVRYHGGGTNDRDGDGTPDAEDAFPDDPNESADNDGDTIGDNSDPDDDNDFLTDAEEGELGTDPLASDQDGDGIVDGRDVEWIQKAVTDLPATAFAPSTSAGGHKRAMTTRLNEIESSTAADDRAGALSQLQTLRRRVDGCGAAADTNDWVISCAEQLEIRALIDRLIRNLST